MDSTFRWRQLMDSTVLDKTMHLTHHPLNISFRCSKTGDTRAYYGCALDLSFRHPRDLTLAEGSEELSDVKAVSREADKWQWRRVYDTPARSHQRVPQQVRHAGLVFDHRSMSRLALLRKTEKELESDKPARPLYRCRVRIEGRPRRFPGHVRSLRAEGLGNAVRMATEEHPTSHGNREPFMRVARDRIRSFDSREMMPQRR